MHDKLSSIPPMTPALMRASKVAKKSGEYKQVSPTEIVFAIENQLNDIKNNDAKISDSEMGELLFLLGVLASKYDIDAEESLYKKTNSFIEKYKN